MMIRNSKRLMLATLFACVGCVYAPVGGEPTKTRTAMKSCMNACALLVFDQQRVVMCGGVASSQPDARVQAAVRAMIVAQQELEAYRRALEEKEREEQRRREASQS